MNSKKSTPNWALLSLLRMILASVVFVAHFSLPYGDGNSPLSSLEILSGTAAVFAFFAISGFSIAHSINQHPGGFLVRRFWRIYPTFFVAVLLALVPFGLAEVVQYGSWVALPPSNSQFFLNFLPVQNVLVEHLSTNVPLWSLGIECCFYVLAIGLVKFKPRALFYVFAVSLALYALNYALPKVSPLVLPLLLWAFAGGWLIYYRRENTMLMTVVLFGYCAGASLLSSSINYGVFTVGAALLALIHQDKIVIPKKSLKACYFLGDLSYPFYATHFPVLGIIYLLTHSKNPLLYIASCLLVSLVVLYCVDKPLRHRGHSKKQRELPHGVAIPVVSTEASQTQTNPA